MLPSPVQAGREHNEPPWCHPHSVPQNAGPSCPFDCGWTKPQASPPSLRRCRSPVRNPQAASTREAVIPAALSVRQGGVLCRPPRDVSIPGIITVRLKMSIENLLPVIFLLRIHNIPPIQIPPVHAKHQHFRRGHVGRKGNIVLVAQPGNVQKLLLHGRIVGVHEE